MQVEKFKGLIAAPHTPMNPDGSINEVEMTSQGASGPLPATKKIEAERACLLYGNVRIQSLAKDNEELAGIRDVNYAGFKYINFEEGADSVEIRVAPGLDSGTIALVLDRSWSPPFARIDIPGGGDGTAWETIKTDVESISGVHTLWLRFRGEGEKLYKVDWLRFY